MNDITFVKVLDSEGNFKHLDLVQGDQVISLKLGNTFASGEHSYVWEVLKDIIDKIATQVHEEAR